MSDCDSLCAIPIVPKIINPTIDIDKIHRAEKQREIILETINDFEKSLGDDHEVALKLASFGQTIVLSVTNIGYHNPDILIFYGDANGSPARLVQHVSQLNFMIMSVPKCNPDAPPRRIGFSASSED